MAKKIYSVQLLAYPQIFHNDVQISGFISSKALILFSYLILEKRTFARDILASMFWGDMPDKRAKANLRQALHNIQKLFPDCFDVNRQMVTVLNEGQFQIDALDLQHLSQQDSISPQELEQASALYKGEFLEGINSNDEFQLDDWLRGQREAYRIAYMTILERLAQHYVTAGIWKKAETSYTNLIRLEPWKESSHRALMLCMARQSNYTAAIMQYKTCQQMLMDEFGEQASYETRRIYEGILTARHRRYQQVIEPSHPLFGRNEEVQQLEGVLLDPNCRLITINGQGGMGKTHLARHISARNEILFLYGVVFLELNTVYNEEQLIRALCDALGLTPTQNDEPFKQIITYLQSQELLIVLDNFEHLLGSINILETLLESAPHITLLLTSREKLNLKQEYALELTGLPIPERGSVLEADAAQLFTARARQIQASFNIENEQVFIDLCQYVNGMPLALEMAAGWVDMLTLKDINHEIQQNIDMLSSSLHNIPQRHRSIRNLFTQTWEYFSKREQDHLFTLTVFQGGFSLQAAQSVAKISAFVLRTFVNKAWLHTAGDKRFVFHELIRQYLDEQLEESAFDMESVLVTHANYYADYFQRFNDDLYNNPYVIGALNAMNLEMENIGKSWQWAIRHHSLEHIDKILESFAALYLQKSQYEALILLLEQTSPFFEDNRASLLLARIYNQLGRAYYYNGQREQSRSVFGKSLQIAQYFEDDLQIAHALHGLAACNMVTDWDECERLLHESVTAYEDASNPVQVALARNTLAATYNFWGRKDEAIPLYQNAYAVLKAVNDSRFTTPLRALGEVAFENADFEQAREQFQIALKVLEQLGNQSGISIILLKLGDLELKLENYDKARSYYEQSLVVSRHFGKSMMAVDCLGRVALYQGQYLQAKQHFSEALRNGVNRDFHMIVLVDCAELFVATEQLELATALASIVLVHPATANVTYKRLEALLSEQKLTEIFAVLEQDKITLSQQIQRHIPKIASQLYLAESLFNSFLEEVINAE